MHSRNSATSTRSAVRARSGATVPLTQSRPGPLASIYCLHRGAAEALDVHVVGGGGAGEHCQSGAQLSSLTNIASHTDAQALEQAYMHRMNDEQRRDKRTADRAASIAQAESTKWNSLLSLLSNKDLALFTAIAGASDTVRLSRSLRTIYSIDLVRTFTACAGRDPRDHREGPGAAINCLPDYV